MEEKQQMVQSVQHHLGRSPTLVFLLTNYLILSSQCLVCSSLSNSSIAYKNEGSSVTKSNTSQKSRGSSRRLLWGNIPTSGTLPRHPRSVWWRRSGPGTSGCCCCCHPSWMGWTSDSRCWRSSDSVRRSGTGPPWPYDHPLEAFPGTAWGWTPCTAGTSSCLWRGSHGTGRRSSLLLEICCRCCCRQLGEAKDSPEEEASLVHSWRTAGGAAVWASIPTCSWLQTMPVTLTLLWISSDTSVPAEICTAWVELWPDTCKHRSISTALYRVSFIWLQSTFRPSFGQSRSMRPP